MIVLSRCHSFFVGLFLLGGVLPGCTVTAPDMQAPETIYPGYTWQQIGAGVYLHSADDPLAGPVDGNSVVIVNDTSVYVVDTHINPAVARAVIGKIRQLTSHPVTHVINTHWHDDHTNGNDAYRDAFPDVQFIAHRATLEALREKWPEMKEQRIAAYSKVDVDQLLTTADKLAADEPMQSLNYRVYAGYVRALKPELGTLDLVYPDTVFDQQLVLGDDGREVVVQWLGPGNTMGDAVVWLPAERILITGDLVVSPVPFAFDAPMQDWVQTLQRLHAIDAQLIVPGHGAPMRDKRHIEAIGELLEATLQQVKQAHDSGLAYAELIGGVDLAEYETRFAGDDPRGEHAFRGYFLIPGVKSAWVALGFPVPEQ